VGSTRSFGHRPVGERCHHLLQAPRHAWHVALSRSVTSQLPS
jgi:hypothetical protein